MVKNSYSKELINFIIAGKALRELVFIKYDSVFFSATYDISLSKVIKAVFNFTSSNYIYSNKFQIN